MRLFTFWPLFRGKTKALSPRFESTFSMFPTFFWHQNLKNGRIWKRRHSFSSHSIYVLALLISYICNYICGFMPNLQKKAWMVPIDHFCLIYQFCNNILCWSQTFCTTPKDDFHWRNSNFAAIFLSENFFLPSAKKTKNDIVFP